MGYKHVLTHRSKTVIKIHESKDTCLLMCIEINERNSRSDNGSNDSGRNKGGSKNWLGVMVVLVVVV